MKKQSFLVSGLVAFLLFGGLSLTVNAQANVNNKNKIQNLGEKVKTRLTANLERVDNLRTRVTERVIQFAEPKFDTVAVNQKLTEAAAAIEAGRQKLAAIDAEITKATTAADKTATVAAFRQTMRDLTANIRAAHQKVVEAIRLMRSAYPRPAVPTTPPTDMPPPTSPPPSSD